MHSQSITEVLQTFNTSKEGLQANQINELRQKYGLNQLPIKKKSVVKMFLSQFNNVLVYILLGALVLTIIAPIYEYDTVTVFSFIDAYAIASILLLNALFGFLQEYKAEEAILSLQQLSAPHARVIRAGKEQQIPAVDLVPGDIVFIEAGDRVSADGRLMKLSHLQINESSLTGESQPAEKTVETINGNVPLANMNNSVFSGTLVTAGSGTYIVTATGTNTQIGAIATLVASTEIPETPLQKRLKSIGATLGKLVLALCTVVIVIGYIQGKPLIETITIAISLAVSAVPEGLPAVVTMCFALGVKRMVSKNAIVRRLDSLETLGSVTVICSDKTGTITENQMKVVDFWLNKECTVEKLATIGASCNTASLPDLGDPTEIGLLEFAQAKGVEREEITEEEVPFNSTDKFMQTAHGEYSYLKGAPEKIVELLSPNNAAEVLAANADFATKGLRVLACAQKVGKTYTLVGLLALEDPPRPSAASAILQAKNAGIRSVMITGDSAITAKAIANRVGILGDALEGKDLDQLSAEELQKVVRTTNIYARVSPTNKLQILHALQANGEIVAMSGDGVNDAPALKGAHVGVAMGKVGTQVAREASSMVLADDKFSTIVGAIAEGRRIYDNIKKFVLFLLRTNFSAIIFISVTILLNWELPYLAIHILWINLVTDGLPALALSVEKAEANIMDRPPIPQNKDLLDGQYVQLALAALTGFLASIALYALLRQQQLPIEVIRTMLLTMALVFELLFVHTVRSTKPLHTIGFFSNKFLIIAVAAPIVLHFIVLYTPLARLLSVTPLSAAQWLQIIPFAMSGLVLFEGAKLVQYYFLPAKK